MNGSLSFVTVKPGTQTLDGRPVPVAVYYAANLQITPTATGGWLLAWTLEDAAGGLYTVEEAQVIGYPPSLFPALPTPAKA